MLSDHERDRLQQIQNEFVAEDPEFVRVLEAGAEHLPSRSAATSGRPYTVFMWVSAVLSFLLLVSGAVGGAALLAAVSASLALTRWAEADSPPA
jgi:hypothetical protein